VNGGLMMALIGGDGAGKTTAINDLYIWLSKEFEVVRVHMGKPRWSWTTFALRGIIKIGRSLGLYPFVRAPIQYTGDSDSIKFPGYPWTIREVCTARDRYLSYVKARRFANNGSLVICDRFPLQEIKLMDGPQIERMTRSHKANRLISYLIRQERKYYKEIRLPELLMVLKVDPKTAVQRKTEESSLSVFPRSTEIWEFDWQRTPFYIIDASRSKVEVLSELKELIWTQL
jgi:thymidylate kinase